MDRLQNLIQTPFMSLTKNKFSKSLMNRLSTIESLPLVKKFLPGLEQDFLKKNWQKKYLKAQQLAYESVKEIEKIMQPGWTEIQTAKLIESYLLDNGVNRFFHKAFVWFGDRTKFANVKTYQDYSPTNRILNEKDIFILDVAPIVDDCLVDIGYSSCFGDPSSEHLEGINFLKNIREKIPQLALKASSGNELLEKIDTEIKSNGFENIHETYPFGVLGHRIHDVPSWLPSQIEFLNFGSASYLSYLGRGLFGQLLNRNFNQSIRGAWAIEPHIAKNNWGMKFEEILIVTDQHAFWLDEALQHGFKSI